jgi:hypothetical protein
LRFTFGGLEHDVGHLFEVGYGDFTATQPADESEYGDRVLLPVYMATESSYSQALALHLA